MKNHQTLIGLALVAAAIIAAALIVAKKIPPSGRYQGLSYGTNHNVIFVLDTYTGNVSLGAANSFEVSK